MSANNYSAAVNCFLPTVQFQITNDMDIDDECDDFSAVDGGAFLWSLVLLFSPLQHCSVSLCNGNILKTTYI